MHLEVFDADDQRATSVWVSSGAGAESNRLRRKASDISLLSSTVVVDHAEVSARVYSHILRLTAKQLAPDVPTNLDIALFLD